MNDRAVSVLDHYEMEVIRTFKGRGTIICETRQGNRVLKEYKGNTEKLLLLNKMQERMYPYVKTDRLICNKEGDFFCKDTDGTVYILKEQCEGRECSYKSEDDIRQAFQIMAKMHMAMMQQDEEMEKLPLRFYGDDMEKRTRECRRVKNYLTKLKTKTEFEKVLLREYDYFLQSAMDVTEQAKKEDIENYRRQVAQKGMLYHGDFQYHNVLFTKAEACVINLERFGRDSGVRDFYLLFRKISEKTEWSLNTGKLMLDAYQNKRGFESWEWKQLEYRLAYPEKFWKIINFYYNSKKSWIPDKNLEKLETLIKQEKAKEKLIKTLF